MAFPYWNTHRIKSFKSITPEDSIETRMHDHTHNKDMVKHGGSI